MVSEAEPDHDGQRSDGTTLVTMIIVEDHAMVAEGLAAALSEDGDIEVVGIASTADQAEEVIHEQSPDVGWSTSACRTVTAHSSRRLSSAASQGSRSSCSPRPMPTSAGHGERGRRRRLHPQERTDRRGDAALHGCNIRVRAAGTHFGLATAPRRCRD